MKKTLATLAALLMVAFVSPVDAGHSMECPDYVQYVPADSLTTSYPAYLTVDEVNSHGYLYSIWIYAESNGVDGIQRHDDYCYTPGDSEDTRDTVIF